MMDPLHLREMFMQIGKDLNCPECRNPIPLSHIKITMQGENNCTVDSSCPNCHEEFHGFASLSAVPQDALLQQLINASSEITREKITQQSLKKSEAESVKQALENFSSFDEFFTDTPKIKTFKKS